MTEITAKPFDWNDNLSEEAIESFESIQKDLPYCSCQSIGMALAKLELLEKQGQKLKTGHWIVDRSVDCYLDEVRCHCSECGKKKVFPADYDHIKQELSISYKYPEFIDKFCPNCGADMRGE